MIAEIIHIFSDLKNQNAYKSPLRWSACRRGGRKGRGGPALPRPGRRGAFEDRGSRWGCCWRRMGNSGDAARGAPCARARSRTVERRLERALWSALFHRDGSAWSHCSHPSSLRSSFCSLCTTVPFSACLSLGSPWCRGVEIEIEQKLKTSRWTISRRGTDRRGRKAAVASCRTWWTTFRPRVCHCGGS